MWPAISRLSWRDLNWLKELCYFKTISQGEIHWFDELCSGIYQQQPQKLSLPSVTTNQSTVMDVTSPLWRIGSCTGPTAVVDRELQDCWLGVEYYLFFSGIIDKEKGEGKGLCEEDSTIYNSKYLTIAINQDESTTLKHQ